ncbi:nuclear transport factor 2 family protein [Pseudomonas sp. NFX224]|uniref:nuclear transport factor 2 family protein n=1 Tax=Pseudomonas sp. NFX224 TaxID=3402862 RepID=UPI003AFB27C6
MSLEARIRALESRNEIMELTARYAQHVTSGDIDALMDLFTPDGTFGAPEKRLTGEALRNMLVNDITPGDRVPLVVNHIIDLLDDEARGTCSMYAPWSPYGPLCGYYKDVYVCNTGRWQFKERWFTFFPTPIAT